MVVVRWAVTVESTTYCKSPVDNLSDALYYLGPGDGDYDPDTLEAERLILDVYGAIFGCSLEARRCLRQALGALDDLDSERASDYIASAINHLTVPTLPEGI